MRIAIICDNFSPHLTTAGTVVTRDGGTPALVRALRAGSLDLAVLGSAPPFRAPDTESPALAIYTLAERDLCVAVPAAHRLAGNDSVDVSELHGQRWIVGRTSGDEPQLGVWPGLDGRPDIAHNGVASSWPISRTACPKQPCA